MLVVDEKNRSGDYIDYELSRNGLLRVGAWILNQVPSLPTAVPNYTQLACIYMAVRETKNTADALFTPHILACRYRNKNFFVLLKVTVAPAPSRISARSRLNMLHACQV